MLGFELQRARKVMRDELRREARNALPAHLALDADDLLDVAADSSGGNRTNVVRRILVMRALASMGYRDAALAEAFHVPAGQVAEERTRSLLASAELARAIDERVARELPLTQEPDRHVYPTGDRARPDLREADRIVSDAVRSSGS